MHSEVASLFITETSIIPIVLGLPWLQTHNPRISWSGQEITAWSCHNACISHHVSTILTSVESLKMEVPVNIKACYEEFWAVFGKAKACALLLTDLITVPLNCSLMLSLHRHMFIPPPTLKAKLQKNTSPKHCEKDQAIHLL